MRIGKRGHANLSSMKVHVGSAKMVKDGPADMILLTRSGTVHLTI
jgi:hypothetical protein